MEQALLITKELTEGMEKAIQLKAHMGQQVSGKIEGMLIEGILSSFENALLILKWGGSMEQSHQHVVPSTSMPGSPQSVIGSPKSEDLNPGFTTQPGSRDSSRKRKAMPTWTEQGQARPENGMEGPPEDGHSWRKYGQKDILGAKYPRSYYRCTYRDVQGCCAIKQVQRNDENPLVFDITYKGKHTCTPTPRSKSAALSSEKPECNRRHNIAITEYQQQPDVTLNFQTGPTIDIQNIEHQQLGLPLTPEGLGYEIHTLAPSALDDNNFYSSFPPSFIPSPATSESNHFSTSPCKMSTFGGAQHGQQSESDITEIISATTSITNSPIVGVHFPLEQWDFSLSFPFDNPTSFPSFY